MKKKKQQSKKTLINKLDRIFSEYIRLRDSDANGYVRCYCCGKILKWRDSQNMHFIPRQHLSLRYNEINCNAGCIKCNYYDNGNIEMYTLNLKKEHGNDIVERLVLHKNRIVKFSAFEYEAMIEEYKKLVAKIRKEKGITS